MPDNDHRVGWGIGGDKLPFQRNFWFTKIQHALIFLIRWISHFLRCVNHPNWCGILYGLCLSTESWFLEGQFLNVQSRGSSVVLSSPFCEGGWNSLTSLFRCIHVIFKYTNIKTISYPMTSNELYWYHMNYGVLSCFISNSLFAFCPASHVYMFCILPAVLPMPTPCLAFLVCLCMHEPALTKRRVFGARPRSGVEVGWHFPNTPARVYTFPIESTRICSNSLFLMASHSTVKNDWFFLWLSWFLLWSGKLDRNLKEIHSGFNEHDKQ